MCVGERVDSEEEEGNGQIPHLVEFLQNLRERDHVQGAVQFRNRKEFRFPGAKATIDGLRIGDLIQNEKTRTCKPLEGLTLCKAPRRLP